MVAVNNMGDKIAALNYYGMSADSKKIVLIYDATNGKAIASLAEEKDSFIGNTDIEICFNHYGDKLATTGFDGIARVWSISQQAESTAKIFEAEGFCQSIAFNREGSKLAAGYSNGAVRVWDANTGKNLFG